MFVPLANPGRFPAMIPSIRDAYFFACFAGMIASPLETRAAIESDVPFPGPLTKPPCANFCGVFPGSIIPGLMAANLTPAAAA